MCRDANYKFIWASVGAQERISDGGVFGDTKFNNMMSNNLLNLPSERPLPGRVKPIPFVFLADNAFSLGKNMMKPYPGLNQKGSPERIHNYRLSRGRRVVENTFGILSSVFRIFRKPMLLEPKKAEAATMACIYLHNYLRSSKNSKHVYCPSGSFDVEDMDTGILNPGSWRKQLVEMSSFQSLPQIPRKSALEVQEIRDEFKMYYVSDIGRVDWQDLCN